MTQEIPGRDKKKKENNHRVVQSVLFREDEGEDEDECEGYMFVYWSSCAVSENHAKMSMRGVYSQVSSMA